MKQDAPLHGKMKPVNVNGVGNPSNPKRNIKTVAAIPAQ